MPLPLLHVWDKVKCFRHSPEGAPPRQALCTEVSVMKNGSAEVPARTKAIHWGGKQKAAAIARPAFLGEVGPESHRGGQHHRAGHAQAGSGYSRCSLSPEPGQPQGA